MTDTWTVETLAEEMLNLMPNLGRAMTWMINRSGDLETTMMQGRVLHLLMQQATRASDIAKKRGVSLQSASALVQGLVEKGWVVRTPDPNDRRQSLLEVTPEGIAVAESARQQMAGALARFLEGLSQDEIAAAQVFLPALQRVLIQHIAPDDVTEEPQPESN